jgi:hypothetical protein
MVIDEYGLIQLQSSSRILNEIGHISFIYISDVGRLIFGFTSKPTGILSLDFDINEKYVIFTDNKYSIEFNQY